MAQAGSSGRRHNRYVVLIGIGTAAVGAYGIWRNFNERGQAIMRARNVNGPLATIPFPISQDRRSIDFRKSVLRDALGVNSPSEMNRLSAQQRNQAMARLLTTSDLNTLTHLGVNDAVLARLRDVHLEGSAIQISEQAIVGLGNRNVFVFAEDYTVEVTRGQKYTRLRNLHGRISFSQNSFPTTESSVAVLHGFSQQSLWRTGQVGESGPILVGHRGIAHPGPGRIENSLEAIIFAQNVHGMNAFEIDIVATSDGRIVCHHDFVLRRFTGHSQARRIDNMLFRDVIGHPLIQRKIHVSGSGAQLGNSFSTSESHLRCNFLHITFFTCPLRDGTLPPLETGTSHAWLSDLALSKYGTQ